VSSRASRNVALLVALGMSVRGLGAVRTTDTTHDFARYQIILDRAPFGAMNSSGADAPQPSFAARFTFVGTAKLSNDQPLLAIIADKEGNHIHFKAEGESIGPVTVVKIEKTDKGSAKLVLKQQLEVATLLLESKPAVGGPAGGFPQPAQPGQPPAPGVPQPGVRRIPFVRGGQ
jgi:hypothetical protein